MRIFALGYTACLVAVAASVSAATFDPVSGAGLLSVGDVQAPFGWTDAQFQERAPAVTFRYRTAGRYSAVCSWLLPQGGVGEELRHPSFAWEGPLTSALRFHTQQRGRIDGFQLLGFTQTPNDPTTPVGGTPCPGPGGLLGTWSNVTPQVQSRALIARFGGVDAVLPF